MKTPKRKTTKKVTKWTTSKPSIASITGRMTRVFNKLPAEQRKNLREHAKLKTLICCGIDNAVHFYKDGAG